MIDPVLEQSYRTKKEQYEREPCCLIEKATKTKQNEIKKWRRPKVREPVFILLRRIIMKDERER